MGLGFVLSILAIVLESPVLELGAVISFLGGTLIVCVALTYGFARLIYGPAHRYANAVKRTFGWVPWPFTFVEGLFRLGRVLFLTNLFPVALLIGVLQLLLSVAMLFIVLPIWTVEQLRLILLPNSPMVTESFCYLVSFGAFATLVASLVL